MVAATDAAAASAAATDAPAAMVAEQWRAFNLSYSFLGYDDLND